MKEALETGVGLRQQGDVLFFEKAESLPGDCIPCSFEEKGRVIFAEGEVHGHTHATTLGPDIRTYRDNADALWAEVLSTKKVSHEEHKPITLTPGIYKIGIVREVDPFTEEIRQVRD